MTKNKREKKKTFSDVRIIGEVVSFKLNEYKSGDFKGEIGIKNTTDSNVCFTEWYFGKREIKYGDKTYAPTAFKSIFMDLDGKPRGIKVLTIGTIYTYSYKTSVGETREVTKPQLRFMMPKPEREDEQVTFHIKGVVESIRNIKEDTQMNIKVGFVDDMWNKERQENEPIIRNVTMFATGDAMDGLEDKEIEKGCTIEVNGDILNLRPRVDKYRRPIDDGTPLKGLSIVYTESVKENTDEEYSKVNQKEKKSKLEVEDDNLDDLGF